jgi:hypothetical protein
VWFEYGTVDPYASAVDLEVSASRGAHELEVFGTIAGEDSGPDVARLDFSATDCRSGDDEPGLSCSLNQARTRTTPSGVALGAGALCLALLGWRRRRSRV